MVDYEIRKRTFLDKRQSFADNSAFIDDFVKGFSDAFGTDRLQILVQIQTQHMLMMIKNMDFKVYDNQLDDGANWTAMMLTVIHLTVGAHYMEWL